MATNFVTILALTLIPILFMLVPVALLVALQVWLCRKSVKMGLILPGITLALSLLLTLSLAAFGLAGGVTVGGGANYVTASGQEIPAQEGPVVQERIGMDFHPRTLIAAVVVFLVTNIPTAVFGGIWLHYKGRQDTYEDLKRMRIEDLE